MRSCRSYRHANHVRRPTSGDFLKRTARDRGCETSNVPKPLCYCTEPVWHRCARRKPHNYFQPALGESTLQQNMGIVHVLLRRTIQLCWCVRPREVGRRRGAKSAVSQVSDDQCSSAVVRNPRSVKQRSTPCPADGLREWLAFLYFFFLSNSDPDLIVETIRFSYPFR